MMVVTAAVIVVVTATDEIESMDEKSIDLSWMLRGGG